MTIGDGTDSAAAGMAIVPGTRPANQLDTAITETRDYQANGYVYWKPGVVLPVTRGGTGAATAADARTALGIPAFPLGTSEVQTTTDATPGSIPRHNTTGKLATNTPTADGHAANKGYVDAQVAGIDLSSRVAKSGDTMSGHLYLPAATAATSGYAVAYINGDGRVSRNASSIRYKDLLDDPGDLGDIWPALREFTLKDGDGKPTLGYIAEELAESADLDRFVVRYGDPEQVESIDFIQLLLAQVAQLNARVAQLEAGDA